MYPVYYIIGAFLVGLVLGAVASLAVSVREANKIMASLKRR